MSEGTSVDLKDAGLGERCQAMHLISVSTQRSAEWSGARLHVLLIDTSDYPGTEREREGEQRRESEKAGWK